ncbi:hypothetical protein TNIN_452791 [Trichonephila inaurata madagascariensis]|uniref:Uncharacterized protein n=1 Tax=Trichonephila inaurata madagascariensis TaxID=2747483 RepID=A0A8X7CUM2_9ARAC|nr:hypothetical protein TNIN_452791 [Trichonephila inaurata madagascariensis]
MAEVTIPVTTPIKEERGIDDSRVVHVKGEQGIVNAAVDTGDQVPAVRADVVEEQSVDNRGTIQITSAVWEHDMDELKGSNMENNDLRHGVVPISKNLVYDMLICSSDYEGLIENSQLVRNCCQEVVTDTLPETYTQSLLNVPNENLVVVKSNASTVQTKGQGIKERKRKVALSADSLDSENNFILSGSVVECWKSNVITLLNDNDEHVKNEFRTFGITALLPNIAITLKRRGNILLTS